MILLLGIAAKFRPLSESSLSYSKSSLHNELLTEVVGELLSELQDVVGEGGELGSLDWF